MISLTHRCIYCMYIVCIYLCMLYVYVYCMYMFMYIISICMCIFYVYCIFLYLSPADASPRHTEAMSRAAWVLTVDWKKKTFRFFNHFCFDTLLPAGPVKNYKLQKRSNTSLFLWSILDGGGARNVKETFCQMGTIRTFQENKPYIFHISILYRVLFWLVPPKSVWGWQNSNQKSES